MPAINRDRLLTLTAALLLGLFVLPGCGDGLPDVDSVDTPEEFVQGMETCIEKLVGTMEKVDDMDSFEANKEDLTKAYSRMLDLLQKAEEVQGDWDKDELKELADKLDDKKDSLKERMEATEARLKKDPELQKAISKHMAEVTENHPYTQAKQQAMKERMEKFRNESKLQHQQLMDRHKQRLGDRPDRFNRPNPHRIRQDFIKNNGGPGKVVTIIIRGIPQDKQNENFSVMINKLTKTTVSVKSGGDPSRKTVMVGNYPDIDALAKLINFGKILDVNHAARVIMVEYQTPSE